MARTKKEIENQLKDFYKRLRQRLKDQDVFDEYNTSEEFTVTGNYESNYIVYIPEAVYDLLPDWERGWEGCEYVMNDEGVGLLGIEDFDDANEQAKEIYGVDSIDDLNPIYFKTFYSFDYDFEPDDYSWWESLGDEIKGKTGLPNESVEIEG